MCNKNIIGINLKHIRLKKGISQELLSARLQTKGLKMDRTTISKIELQRRQVLDFEILYLSECLDIDIKELFYTKPD